MRQRDKQAPQSAEEAVRDIRRATRRHFSAEEKIRIVVEGLRGEDSIAELCRKEGIAQNLYYRWSKEFLEAGWVDYKFKSPADNQEHEKSSYIVRVGDYLVGSGAYRY